MTGASTGYDYHHTNADEDEIAVLANLRRCMDETRSRLLQEKHMLMQVVHAQTE
jgi:hypothetical protein